MGQEHDVVVVGGGSAEPDKNAGGAPGAGLVPGNAVDGVRVNPAMAYLTVALGLDGQLRRRPAGVTAQRGPLAVRGDSPAERVVLDGTLAVGVRLVDGTTVHAGEVVLAAAIDPAGDCQLLLLARPFEPGGSLHLMCQLMQLDSRGRLTLPDPDGPPRIAYRYLRTEQDRRRLRHAVRVAADLVRAGLGARVGPSGADRGLDWWIAAHLTTAQHLCGTASMGPADDPRAVVDPALCVHGIERLRVVDLSVLPVAPRRGTAATAVAVGEAGAEFLGARPAGTAG